ncbi:aminotransferase class III-fold pyridoxal phosphate-dependent enzyme, partial [Pseudomonas syringae]
GGADLALVGKASGGGVPGGARVGEPEQVGLFGQGEGVRAGTEGGAPPACAAVLAALRQLATADYPALLRRGDQLRAQLVAAVANKGMAVSSTGYGSVFTLWPSAVPSKDYAAAAQMADSRWTLAFPQSLPLHRGLSMPFAFGRACPPVGHPVCSEARR